MEVEINKDIIVIFGVVTHNGRHTYNLLEMNGDWEGIIIPKIEVLLLKVWQLHASQGCMLFSTTSEESNLFTDHFDGTPMNQWYKPEKLLILRKGKYRDFPHIIPGALIFSKKARTVMEPLVSPFVEFLEVDHSEIKDIEIDLVNVINVIDALDYERTEFTYYPSGRMSGYNKVYFKPEVVRSNPIFRVPEKTVRIYVTDEFRDFVLRSKLKGYDFEEVWDSEDTAEKEQARQQHYDSLLAAIENSKGPEVSFSEALALVNAGKAMASGQWKLQADPVDGVLLGQLTLEGDYFWIDPLFYPPILLEMQWHEVELSEIGGK